MRLAFLLLVFGVGAVHAAGPWRADERNSSGWALMTPKERLDHQTIVRSFTDYNACHAYQLRHHKDMQARAEASAIALKPGSRDICEHLRPAPAKP